MFRTARLVIVVVIALLIPITAYAQGSIAGTAKDASGAVLPGVTVEAASPALIEKVRSAVTDGTGQFRILDLRPGAYVVTFTLPGFSTVKRENIEVSGTGTTLVNADLRVGALEETITVTSEAPIVDTQNATRERVLSREVIDTVPTGRNHANLAVLVPGVIVAGSPGSANGLSQDVGGSSGDSHAQLAVHGSRGADQRFTIGGVTFGEGNGQTHGMGPNVANMAEVAVDTSAVDASQAQGGVRINFIPRDGGNRFSGGAYYTAANDGMQGSNIDADLRSRGATTGSDVKMLYDINATLGGPIVADKLWFFGSWRRNHVQNFVPNVYANVNYNTPNFVRYEKDLSKQLIGDSLYRYTSGRLTWQASQRNKIAFSYDWRARCACPQSTTNGPESATNVMFNPFHLTQATWSSPLTSRLLMDAGLVYLDALRRHRSAASYVPGNVTITETQPRPGFPGTFNGSTQQLDNIFPTLNMRYAVSYVTGSHALQTGIQLARTRNDNTNLEQLPTYTLSNGVPTQVTVNGNPVTTLNRQPADLGIYVQDKWTMDRLTLSGGLRFDYINTYAPEQHVGPSKYAPTRNVTFPETPLLRWKDLSPKMSAIYDVRGTGQTALRVSLNKYLSTQGAGGPGNPSSELVNTAARAWTDGNNNFIPDCDLASPALQDNRASGGDLCGAFTGNAVNFGRTVPGTQFDPEIKFGWGKRSYNWEFATGVQHAVTSRLSVDVGYFRRWYGNFLVTDNRNLVAADYDKFSIVAPVDSRLPGGGGNTINGFININPAKASIATDNYQTFASNYGKQIEHWNGVDLSANLRLGRAVFQGGSSTGRTSTDNCEILAKVPEAGNVAGFPYCHVDTNWLTQIKMLGSYTVPRVDVQFSATFQSLPGPQLSANYVAANAAVQQSLGRPLSGNAANVTLNIVEPGTLYGERLNQMDLRFGKILRFGGMRSNLSLDLYNLFNANAVVTENSAFSAWRAPQGVLPPRLIKFTAQLDF